MEGVRKLADRRGRRMIYSACHFCRRFSNARHTPSGLSLGNRSGVHSYLDFGHDDLDRLGSFAAHFCRICGTSASPSTIPAESYSHSVAAAHALQCCTGMHMSCVACQREETQLRLYVNVRAKSTGAWVLNGFWPLIVNTRHSSYDQHNIYIRSDVVIS